MRIKGETRYFCDLEFNLVVSFWDRSDGTHFMVIQEHMVLLLYIYVLK